jgi:hypothetical protein
MLPTRDTVHRLFRKMGLVAYITIVLLILTVIIVLLAPAP